jgi:cellulose synthase/poly-beta-1,6-N-acetylglucosamine synthase-like glycosyltransferase
MTPSPLVCSIGVFAYNEEKNISKVLDALLEQELESVTIKEIIVVASGCTDSTEEIVTAYEQRYDLIRLLHEDRRAGKSSSINHFISEAKSEILVIESGDTIPAKDTVEKIVSVFNDKKTGMSGGRPIPENNPASLVGYAVQLLWRMHHEMALVEPKLGEMVAFRKVFKGIPPESAVDEASIEALITQNGLKTRYIPGALIYNKGPENIKDFVKQRRRIETGHLWLKHQQNYAVSSQNKSLLLKIAWKEFKSKPLSLPRLVIVILMEIWCRFLGNYDFYIKKKNPFVWDIAQSTKELSRK